MKIELIGYIINQNTYNTNIISRKVNFKNLNDEIEKFFAEEQLDRIEIDLGICQKIVGGQIVEGKLAFAIKQFSVKPKLLLGKNPKWISVEYCINCSFCNFLVFQSYTLSNLSMLYTLLKQ